MIRLAARGRQNVLSISYLRSVAANRPTIRSFWNVREIITEREEAPKPVTPSELSNEFKRLLRSVPHALTIISATAEKDDKATGLLVSSFNSITAFPIPYVSFNIKVPSATLDAIESSKHFTASVIDSPYTADVFAQRVPNAQELRQDMLKPNGILKFGHGGVFWMRCIWSRKHKMVVGDHAVIVGEVLNIGQYPGSDLAGEAMAYWQGHYTQVRQRKQRTMYGADPTRGIVPKQYGGIIRNTLWPPKHRTTKDIDEVGNEPQGASGAK